MSTAEKAKDLVNEVFYQPITKHLNINNNAMQIWEYAKRCAVITVDQILLGIKAVIGDQRHMWTEHQLSEVLYWEQVKAEIEIL